MTLAVVVIALAVGFVIAAVVLGREAARLAAQPPKAVVEMEEAVEFVAERLSPETQASLSYEDVRQLMVWHVDLLRRAASADDAAEPASPDGPDDPSDEVVVDAAAAVEHLMSRSAAAGLELTATEASDVVEAQLAYFRSIGAFGPATSD